MLTLSRREFVRVTALTTAGTVAAACAAPAPQASLEGPAGAASPAAANTTVPPATTAPVALPTQAAPPTAAPAPTQAPEAASRFQEAPMLAELVAKGELPPVDERLPENPPVNPVLEAIGKHGGTLRRAFSGVSDRNGPAKVNYCSLVHYNFDLTLRPDIIESWDMSPDASEYTLHLRPGLRWSDGEPFDQSAFSWWYENVLLNKELTKAAPVRYSTGTPYQLMQMTTPDDYTVVVTFADPNPLWMYFMNSNEPYIPGHYMRQYHLELCDDKEALLTEVKEKGFNS